MAKELRKIMIDDFPLMMMVVKSSVARQQLSQCGGSLDLEKELEQDLFVFTRQVIYGDKKSGTMTEACAAKWKTMKKKIIYRPYSSRCR